MPSIDNHSTKIQFPFSLLPKLVMTSTTPPPLEHPIEWTEASASRHFPVPIRQTNKTPIETLFEDLEPRWLGRSVTLQQAMRDACENHPPGTNLPRQLEFLRRRQSRKLLAGRTQEENTADFCIAWLRDLHETRKLSRWRNRSVQPSQPIVPPVCVYPC
jgi:hypothetical protein